MFVEIMGILATALAILFYSITAYNVVLIFVGLRMARGWPRVFDKGSLRNPVDLPKVSIIVPAKDEEMLIEGAIRCAQALDYPREMYEIIVVTDGSEDRTPEIAEGLQAEVGNLMVLHDPECTGKPAALNRGLGPAKGEVVAIFDVDTRYDPDLLLRVAKFLHDHPETEVVQAVPKIIDADENVITKLNAYEMLFWYEGLHTAKDKYGLFLHLTGAGMFVKREVFERIGTWDETCVAEDLEFAWRYSSEGGRAALMPVEVGIQPTYTSRTLFRQRRRWWTGMLQVLGKRIRAGSDRKLPLKLRLDTAIYLISPVVVLVSVVSFVTSLGFVMATGSMASIFGAWIFGFLGTNMLLFPLVIAETVLRRDVRLLLLIPGLYWYWIIQALAIGAAFFTLVSRRRVKWEKTPKRAWRGE